MQPAFVNALNAHGIFAASRPLDPFSHRLTGNSTVEVVLLRAAGSSYFFLALSSSPAEAQMGGKARDKLPDTCVRSLEG
jgi:hypothetical protein